MKRIAGILGLLFLGACSQENMHIPRLYRVDDYRLQVTCIFDLDWKTMACYPNKDLR